jgi:hypothetical protein
VFGNGILRLRSGSAQSIDAHCRVCGAKLDRKFKEHPTAEERGPLGRFRSQGRPLGLLMLWLSAPCTGNPDKHNKEFLKRWKVTPGFLWDQRSVLRDQYKDDPRFTRSCRSERAPWPEEANGEPFDLCGVW